MEIKPMGKKGVFDQVSDIFKGVVVVAIIAVVSFLILSNLASNAQVVADANATDAVGTIQDAAAGIPAWIPIIIIVIIGALLIFLVSRFSGRR